MIHHIITNRPYRSVEDLKTVPSVTRVGYKLLEPRVCCIPAIKAAPKSKPKPKNIGGKLNLNTASVEDLRRIGFGKITAEFIVKYRTKNGPFSDVEDLRKISRVGNGSMARIGQKLEV